LVAEAAGVPEDDAASALHSAWRRHQTLWHRRIAFTGADITRLALETLGSTLDVASERKLIVALEEEALTHEVRAVDGARESLALLARAGVRRALICDTGFTPGRVVRQLLDRVGLLDFLEVSVFSDEVGVPKPHPKAFYAALDALGVPASGSVHVGDLRRSDIAGAKSVEMGSVRLRARHDDTDEAPERTAGVVSCKTAGCNPFCERPEADAVADSYGHLLEILEFG
jgi:putative hydrolase of the HAD superfamily